MLPMLWQFYGVDPCYFQDDNATCHVTRDTISWYGDNRVQRLDWPAQSADLKPIEHLYNELEHRLMGFSHRLTLVTEFSCILEDKWEKIPLPVVQRLVESKHQMIAAVINACQGSANYRKWKNMVLLCCRRCPIICW